MTTSRVRLLEYRLLRFFAVALLLLTWQVPVLAEIDCPELLERPGIESTPYEYYVIVYLNLFSPAKDINQQATILRQLEDRFNSADFPDFSRNLAKRNKATPTRYIKLIACHTPNPSTFSSDDLLTLTRYRVIVAVYQSADRLSYLVFPYYATQNRLPKEEVQLVLGSYDTKGIDDPSVAWITRLARPNKQAREAVLALGLALVFLDQIKSDDEKKINNKKMTEAEMKGLRFAALISLCVSDNNFSAANANKSFPPDQSETLTRIGKFLDETRNKLGETLRKNFPEDFKAAQQDCSNLK